MMEDPKNCFLSLREIRERLTDHFELSLRYISISTIYKALKSIKIKRKRVKAFLPERNTQKTKEDRKRVSCEILYCLKNNWFFIFVDEVGFNKNLVPLYGYSKTGTRIQSTTAEKGINYSVIAAMSNEGFICFQIFKGSVKAGDFWYFMVELLKICLNRNKDRKYIFLMDNASIHHAKNYETIKNKFTILSNAPYSPMINPIEEMFSKWKHTFRQKTHRNDEALVAEIVKSSTSITKKDCEGYYLHMFKFLEKSYKYEDIY